MPRLTSFQRTDKKKAADEMTNAKDKLAKAQTEKNGICSLKVYLLLLSQRLNARAQHNST